VSRVPPRKPATRAVSNFWSNDPDNFGVDWEDLIADRHDLVALLAKLPANCRRAIRLLAASPTSVRLRVLAEMDEAATAQMPIPLPMSRAR
jgi:hypothetical protein